MKATKIAISVGDPGTERTLHEMRRIVVESATNPDVIGWAHDVIRFTPERDVDAAAAAFLSWVRSHVRYTDDPVDVESVKTPEVMVNEFARAGKILGDCDDQVVLLASGLNAIGVATEFIVIAADSRAPGEYSHVLLQYHSPRRGGWVTMDPIMRGTGVGWFPPRYSRIGRYSGGRLAGTHRNGGGVGMGGVIVTVAALWWLASRKAG